MVIFLIVIGHQVEQKFLLLLLDALSLLSIVKVLNGEGKTFIDDILFVIPVLILLGVDHKQTVHKIQLILCIFVILLCLTQFLPGLFPALIA
jgi:hypothetical protein